MQDDTESIRRAMIASNAPAVDVLFADKTWDTDALRAEFEVLGFMAPFVVVRRRSDGMKGSMEFTHYPRTYFNFVEDRK